MLKLYTSIQVLIVFCSLIPNLFDQNIHAQSSLLQPSCDDKIMLGNSGSFEQPLCKSSIQQDSCQQVSIHKFLYTRVSCDRYYQSQLTFLNPFLNVFECCLMLPNPSCTANQGVLYMFSQKMPEMRKCVIM